MKQGARPLPALLAWMVVGLGGCASMRHEPPPEVAPQPPAATTTQMIAAQSASAPSLVRRSRPSDATVTLVRERRAAAPYPLDFSQRLDDAHDRVYAWTQRAVEATDRRFVDDGRAPRPVPAAPFRLGLVGEYLDRSDGPELELLAEFDIALNLPNLERRLRVVVSSGSLDEAPRNSRETEGLRASLRYQLLEFVDFDLGVRVDVPPVAFASLKWTREFDLGRWDFYPFAKIFAETKESVGYAAAATFDNWSGRHLFRTSTYAKWRADRDRTEWSQTLIYARAHELIVPDRHGSYPRANDIGRGWGVRLLAGGETARAVDHYEAGIFYRRPFANRWLYWSAEPLVRWDREYAWSADPGIRLGLEMLFWDLVR
jgi:hypothetical protein